MKRIYSEFQVTKARNITNTLNQINWKMRGESLEALTEAKGLPIIKLFAEVHDCKELCSQNIKTKTLWHLSKMRTSNQLLEKKKTAEETITKRQIIPTHANGRCKRRWSLKKYHFLSQLKGNV